MVVTATDKALIGIYNIKIKFTLTKYPSEFKYLSFQLIITDLYEYANSNEYNTVVNIYGGDEYTYNVYSVVNS